MAFTGLSDSAKEDMIVSLATLVLHDGGKEMTVRATCCSRHHSCAPPSHVFLVLFHTG